MRGFLGARGALASTDTRAHKRIDKVKNDPKSLTL